MLKGFGLSRASFNDGRVLDANKWCCFGSSFSFLAISRVAGQLWRNADHHCEEQVKTRPTVCFTPPEMPYTACYVSLKFFHNFASFGEAETAQGEADNAQN